MHNNTQAWLPGLELVRAAAIFLVVWAHGRLLLPKGTFFDQPWLAPAHWGIELFFALSGYLIVGQVATLLGAGSWRSLSVFCLKRFLRTIPVYWIILAGLSFTVPVGLRIEVWLQEAFFLRTLPVLNVSVAALLAVNWSLAVEEMSYVLFAVLALLLLLLRPLWVARQMSERTMLACLMIALIIIAVLVRFSAARQGCSLDQLKFSAILHIDALAYGGLARLWVDRQRLKSANWGPLPWLILAGMMPLTVWLGFVVRAPYLLRDPSAIDLSPYSFCAYCLSRIVAAGLVMAMAVMPSMLFTGRIAWGAVIGSTSAASYSTYLLHQVVVLEWATRLQQHTSQGWGLFVLYVVLSLALGYLSFQLLEKPWIILRRQLR